MEYETFLSRAKAGEPAPEELSKPLQALWVEAGGDWDEAHAISQDAGSREGDWVHAYLHRKEGDAGNASYWYSRSGKPFFEGSLDEEWEHLVRSLLRD